MCAFVAIAATAIAWYAFLYGSIRLLSLLVYRLHTSLINNGHKFRYCCATTRKTASNASDARVSTAIVEDALCVLPTRELDKQIKKVVLREEKELRENGNKKLCETSTDILLPWQLLGSRPNGSQHTHARAHRPNFYFQRQQLCSTQKYRCCCCCLCSTIFIHFMSSANCMCHSHRIVAGPASAAKCSQSKAPLWNGFRASGEKTLPFNITQ